MSDTATLEAAPDAATTTNPITEASGNAPDEWDVQDELIDKGPSINGPAADEFEEDFDARKAKEADETTTPVESEAKPDETPAAQSETSSDQSGVDSEVEGFKAKAETFDQFDNALRTDPAAVAKAIYDGLKPDQKMALAQQILNTAPATGNRTAFNLQEYTPQGEMEGALAERWADIESIPELVNRTRELGTEIEDRVKGLVPHVSHAGVASELALHKIDAICQLLGIDLPDAADDKIIEALKDGRTTYRSAVRKSVDYKTHVEMAKQAKQPRPKTVANENRSDEPFPEGTSAVEIARRMGTLKR